MRTTVDIDKTLLAAARRRAKERGITLKAVIEEALAAALELKPSSPETFKLQWKTHRGRLVAGVNVADREALFDAMEQRA